MSVVLFFYIAFCYGLGFGVYACLLYFLGVYLAIMVQVLWFRYVLFDSLDMFISIMVSGFWFRYVSFIVLIVFFSIMV